MEKKEVTYRPIRYPINLVLITLANDMNYLFRVPDSLPSLSIGDWVLCKTAKGSQTGRVASEIIRVENEQALQFIIALKPVKKLEPIIAVMSPAPTADTDTIIIGKGVQTEVVTTTSAPDDAPYITVHMPGINNDSMGVF